MALGGFRMIVSDLSSEHWACWQRAGRKLGIRPKQMVLDAQDLALETGTLDIYLSVSVLEHMPDKARALREAARVLRPGGMVALTFDICEPEMGMTFPASYGTALSMNEFDRLVRENPWFEPGLAEQAWNTADIPAYLAWHRAMSPHHNYVTAGAILIRNKEAWRPERLHDFGRAFRGRAGTLAVATGHEGREAIRGARRLFDAGLWRNQTSRLDSVKLQRRLFISLSLPKKPVQRAHLVSRLVGLRGTGRTFALRNFKRVLVVRPDELREVVLTSPLLRELRRNLPEAWITLVVKPSAGNLVACCPHVNQVLTYDRDGGGVLRSVSAAGTSERVSITSLWARRYDLAVLPRFDVDTCNASELVSISGARWRIGYSESATSIKRELNAGYDRILTHRLVASDVKHEAERGLDILRALGGKVEDTRLETWTDRADEEALERFLLSSGHTEAGRLAAFAPGTGGDRRSWPLARYAELGEWLADALHFRLVIIGSAEEAPSGRLLAQALGGNAINAMGALTLRQSAALLRRCGLYVGRESAPMHLAAAAGVPVVETCCHPVNGSAADPDSPRRFGPWGVPNRVLQPDNARSPCVDGCLAAEPHCICSVSVEHVKAAVTSLMDRQEGKCQLP
jgi:heptosyltransferase-2